MFLKQMVVILEEDQVFVLWIPCRFKGKHFFLCPAADPPPKKWKIIKEESHLIGDKETDISCGIKFGIKSHLFKGGSLLKFVEDILN